MAPATALAEQCADRLLGSEARQRMIARSQERSRSLGLRENDAPDFTRIQRWRLELAREQNRLLLQSASPALAEMLEYVLQTGSMVILTDAEGLILHAAGDSSFLQRAAQVALMPGVVWSEGEKGTNAIGTALTEQSPVVVHGDEHFLRANRFLTCACAPIYDPCGQLAGALDVTGHTQSYHPHTLALVHQTALLIEQQLLMHQLPEAMRLHFHSQVEGLGTFAEGVLALDTEGRVLGANRSAEHLLRLARTQLRQQSLESLFAMTMAQWWQLLRSCSNSHFVLRRPDGTLFYARAWLPSWRRWVQRRQSPLCQGCEQVAILAPQTPRWEPPNVVSAKPTSCFERKIQESGGSALRWLDMGDAQVAAVIRKLQRVIDKNISILLLGETGTGKELFARAIHFDSRRRDNPFVALNCAAIPENLIESELFGYEEGAFTGAKRKGSVGKILQANGGTLFLDEIGDMPLSLQTRLLRVLQEREVVPLGSTKAHPVDFALICATHRDLKAMIAQGTFREDLYYRINGLCVRLPALRERTDFEAVVKNLLWSLVSNGKAPQISPRVMDLLGRYDWPGNIRQLQNVLRTALALAEGEATIEREHLPDDFLEEIAALQESASTEDGGAMQTRGSLDQLEIIAMAEAVRACHGNISAAAKRLGVSRNTLYRKRALWLPLLS